MDRLEQFFVAKKEKSGHHKLPIVAKHGTLARSEAVGFGPPQANSQAQHALPRIRVLGASVTYGPGIPIAPPARVRAINELSAVAGCCVPACSA
jgi:hypothetical protein